MPTLGCEAAGASMLAASLMVGVGLESFLIGAAREVVALDTLYRLSASYPLVTLAFLVLGRSGVVGRVVGRAPNSVGAIAGQKTHSAA